MTASILRAGTSSAALAKIAAAPVILVIDTLGMTRGVAPLVLGYQVFDPGIKIAGIILNKVGTARQESKVRQAIERYTGIPVLGALPRDGGFAIEERHLGLMTPMETPASRAAIERLRQAVESGVDLDGLLEIASKAPPLAAVPAAPAPWQSKMSASPSPATALSASIMRTISKPSSARAPSFASSTRCRTPAFPMPMASSSAAVFRKHRARSLRPTRR